MLKITIPPTELWDETKEEFVTFKGRTLALEHSLVSLSKWESKWCKPFVSKQEKTLEETIDYIKCMTLTQNVSDDVYKYLTSENIADINKYIDAPMTATWFSESKDSSSSQKQVTSELIYYWMITLNIPFECQKWHLNRLLTLIRVCNEESKPAKKMSARETIERNRALNEKRRAQLKNERLRRNSQ